MSDNWLDEYKEGLFSGRIPMRNPKIKKPGDPEYYYYDPRGMDKNAPLKDWKLIGVPTADTPNPALAEMEKIVDLEKIPQSTYYDSYGRTSSKPVKVQDSIRLDPLDYPAVLKRNPESWVLPKDLENIWSSPYHTQEEMEEAKQKLAAQLINEEKKKDFPYLDTRGNYTIGVGHMHEKKYGLAQHPWINRDTGAWASYDEINSNLLNLDKQPLNYMADFYKNKTNLSLPEKYLDYLLEYDMASRIRELKRGIPNFEKMSPDMQIALMEPHFTSNILPWSKLREAAKNMNKEGVCKELHRDESGRPDLVSRNKWVYEQCMKGYFNK